MADERFDELTRMVAGPQSRRSMLKYLLALATGAALVPAAALAEEVDRGHLDGKKMLCLTRGSRCAHAKHSCCPGLQCLRQACKVGSKCPPYKCLKAA